MLELSGVPLGDSKQSYGGDTINSAIYCARAAQSLSVGLHVYFVSSLGGDALSSAMLQAWQHETVDTRFVLRDQQRLPGIYAIETDADGERSFHYWRSDSAARHMMAHGEFAQVASALSEMQAIYISGISLAILPENDQKTMLEYIKTWKASGCEIYFDPNVRPRLWKNLTQARQVLKPMYDIADIVFTSEQDEKLLWEDASNAAQLQRLTRYSAPLVILKQGENGCVILRNNAPGDKVHVPGAVGVAVVDTTAAGDTFNAVFIAERAVGKNVERACRVANHMAALVIQQAGAIIDTSLFANAYRQYHIER